MKPYSLLKNGTYDRGWVKDFYNTANDWWGTDPQGAPVHQQRVKMIERLCGAGNKRILELGAGSGQSAAALADAGHQVTAVELSSARAGFARQLAAEPRLGSIQVVEGDFYTVQMDGQYDVICAWETFGLGSDADQRRLLKRISSEWLAPDGFALLDVYYPAMMMRNAGKKSRLNPLPGVPGSVLMDECCHFDFINSRWIDEWVPVEHPENALAQSIRCYTPVDFLLLLEGTALKMDYMEVEGQSLDLNPKNIHTTSVLRDAWYFVARLRLADPVPSSHR
jgi:SAM-dependent methyltransferase